MPALQRRFEDLGTPLADVTFCVLDLETTGGSAQDSITEVGALKVARGETVGTFQTLVDPGRPVPSFIRLLTGISDELVLGAPTIEAVLPSLLSFIGDSVIVAHNARFDVSFLNRALVSAGYPKLSNPVVDTAALARKALAGEVRNRKLATLARHFRCAHQPCHRAFADVLATTDVLHHLIERLTGFGVTTLEDLMSISYTRMDGTFNKISLAQGLPDGPGIYRFLGVTGKTLYVGKSSSVRKRVRSYFYGDPRRKMRDLLKETQSIAAEPYGTMLEAEVAEARAISSENPPFNRAGKGSSKWFVKLAIGARAPKLYVTRTPKDDGAIYVGPLRSSRTARTIVDAIRDVIPVHRCSAPATCNGCAFSQMGTCEPPGSTEERVAITSVAHALLFDPTSLLEGLHRKMARLAKARRFEEAAELRDKGAMLERVLRRHIGIRALVDAGTARIEVGGRSFVISNGRLGESQTPALPYLTDEQAREAATIVSFLTRHAEDVRLLSVSGCWSSPVGARPFRAFYAQPRTLATPLSSP